MAIIGVRNADTRVVEVRPFLHVKLTDSQATQVLALTHAQRRFGKIGSVFGGVGFKCKNGYSEGSSN